MELFSQRKFINTLLLIALVVLTLSGFLYYQQMKESSDANYWVIHTYQVKSAANLSLLSLTKMEADINLYLISDNSQALQDYSERINTVKQNAQLIKNLTSDNPQQQYRAEQILPLIEKNIQAQQQILAMYNSMNKVAAWKLAAEQQYLSEQISRLIQQIISEELSLLEKRTQISNREEMQSRFMFIITGCISELFLLLSFILINYHLLQRKRFEDKLRASEAYQTAILQSAMDSIIITDQQGTIVSCNPQTIQMFGYNENELKNINIEKLLPGITKNLLEYDGKQTVELIGMPKTDGNFPIELTLARMSQFANYQFVIIIRDITERKNMEKIKDEFISVVSHELRTPLTSIRGSLGLVIGGTVGTFSDKAKNLLEIANNNCD